MSRCRVWITARSPKTSKKCFAGYLCLRPLLRESIRRSGIPAREAICNIAGARPDVVRPSSPAIYRRATFAPSIVIPRVTTTVCPATSRPSRMISAVQARTPLASETGITLERLSRLAHEVTAGGTLARATRLSTSNRGFVQTRFVISGRYVHEVVVQHSLRKRSMEQRIELRQVQESGPPRPTSNELARPSTLGFDDCRSSALHQCSNLSSCEFARDRACPINPAIFSASYLRSRCNAVQSWLVDPFRHRQTSGPRSPAMHRQQYLTDLANSTCP